MPSVKKKTCFFLFNEAQSIKVKVYKNEKKLLQKIHKTIGYLQKLRYIHSAFCSVEQCRSVEQIFFNNIVSFELGHQTPKYLMPLFIALIAYKKK